MKLGPFSIGGEEESEEKYTTTGQMRSLVKQVLLAVSPFVAVGIIGVIGIPPYMVFWAQVIFFAVYLLLIAGVYLNIQREAVTYLCFPYVHMWIGTLPLPPVCLFFKEPEDLDAPDKLKEFFRDAQVLTPNMRKELEEAVTSVSKMKGDAHFAGFHLKTSVYAGAFKRFDNLILITHSPISQVMSFLGSMEVLFQDIPVTNSRCELASLSIVDFRTVFGIQTAIAYVMESTLRAKSVSNLAYTGKEPEAAQSSMLLNSLGQITKAFEDQTAHMKGFLKFQNDREGFVDENISFLVEKYRSLGRVPTKSFLAKLKLRDVIIIGVVIIGGLFVASYFGWLPRLTWGK